MKTFDVILRVTARNFTREEAELQGFDLEEAEDYGDLPYNPDDEPIDSQTIGECMADAFHEEMVNEMLAGSDLMCTLENVRLIGVNELSVTA